MPAPTVNAFSSMAMEQRIARLTLVFGALAGGIAAVQHDLLWATGLMVGAVLAWFNLRWIRQAMDALVLAAEAQAGAEKPRVPVGTYFLALFRYGLMAITVYVIFKVLKVPLASMVVGLCALAAATMAASVYEIMQYGRIK